MEKVTFRELRKRVSWGSVIAGVMTVLAISVLLSILSTSIGFFKFDPESNHPMHGIGTTMGIWTVISLIVSLAAGGFVAGKLAGADGIIHGFLVWATTMIVTVIFGAFLAVGAIKLTSNVLGSVASATGNVISGVGSAVGNGMSGMGDEVESIFGDIDFDSDMDELKGDVHNVLVKSGVRELQPQYLKNQYKGVKSDLRKTARKIARRPKDADKLWSSFTDRVKQRTDRITRNIDRDALITAVANNTNMSRAEAAQTVDQYVDMLNNGVANLEQSIDQAKQDWEQFKREAAEEAEKATNAAGKAGLISFFALLVGACLCAFMGYFGVKKTWQGYEV